MVRKVSVLVVAVLALVAAACGQARQDAVVQVDTELDAHALAASADRTSEATTAKVHLELTTSTTGASGSKAFGGGSFHLTGDGAYDTSSGLSTMILDLGSGIAGSTEVVQHGDISYLRMPMLTALVPSFSGSWLKVDRSKAASLRGGSSSPLSGTNGVGDPSAFLDYLRGVGADVSTVGHEDVGGVDTTHVHATVSVQQALDAAGADRAKLDRSLQQLPGMGEAFERQTFPIDVYLDDDGYVRRVSIAFDSTGATATTMTMTLDFSDFGEPVTITEPAASDTTDLCDLLSALPMRQGTATTLPAGVC